MRVSCIRHPAHDRQLILRQWQIQACEGNMCAGALLSFFEYWHDVKLSSRQQAKAMNNVCEKHGDQRSQDESLFQWHTTEELQQGILGLYGESVIQKSVKQLETLGFISIHTNPNPKYKFDRTHFYLFHVEAVEAWIGEHYPDDPGVIDTSQKDTNETVNLRDRDREIEAIDGRKNTGAISLITTKITLETKENTPPISPIPESMDTPLLGVSTPMSSPRHKRLPQTGVPEWSDTLPWPKPLSLAALYNARKPEDWSRVELVAGSRLKKCEKYLKAYPDQAWWGRVLDNLATATWLRDHLDAKYKTFDWLVKEGVDGTDNCLKVADGFYQSSKPRPVAGRYRDGDRLPDGTMFSDL